MAAAILVSACDSSIIAFEPVLAYPYEIDPVFREYYNKLGGADVLGLPISPMYERENVRYQFTAAVKMVNDPQAPENQLFRLAPLGLELGIRELPLHPPPKANDRFVDGHWIGAMFWKKYNDLGGARVAGRPITEVHYNPDLGRHEQHFENLGLYWSDKDLPGNIHLLAYGVHLCADVCDKLSKYDGEVVIPPAIGDQFRETVSRLGADFTGFALSDVYDNPDGQVEQVFEYLVLVSDPDQGGRVFTRPIVEVLDLVSMDEQANFKIHPGFQDYIALHGGIEIVGEPVTDLELLDDVNSRQCYTNMCLVAESSLSGSVSVRPYPIGYEYLQSPMRASSNQNLLESQEEENILVPKSTEVSALEVTPREIVMHVWVSFQIVAPNQSQEIGVSITENNVPLKGIQPYLTVSLPDGEEKTISMFPTGDDGVSRMFLGPIDTTNNTLIPYAVCFFDNNFEQYCVRDGFTIWQNP